MQTPGNAEVTTLCALCSRQCGTAEEQLARFGVEHVPLGIHSDRSPAAVSVACLHGSHARYCCEAHRAQHYRQSHGALCSGPAAQQSAYAEFREFAADQCNSMLLAAELVAASVMDSAASCRKRTRAGTDWCASPCALAFRPDPGWSPGCPQWELTADRAPPSQAAMARGVALRTVAADCRVARAPHTRAGDRRPKLVRGDASNGPTAAAARANGGGACRERGHELAHRRRVGAPRWDRVAQRVRCPAR